MFSPLGHSPDGLTTSFCVHSVPLASISQKPFRIYFYNLAYLRALLPGMGNVYLIGSY